MENLVGNAQRELGILAGTILGNRLDGGRAGLLDGHLAISVHCCNTGIAAAPLEGGLICFSGLSRRVELRGFISQSYVDNIRKRNSLKNNRT